MTTLASTHFVQRMNAEAERLEALSAAFDMAVEAFDKTELARSLVEKQQVAA